jgi:hypothetical protein
VEAVYDLSTAKPHEFRRGGYSRRDYAIYCEGYFMALSIAVQVLELAARRFALRVKTRRAENKAARARVDVA